MTTNSTRPGIRTVLGYGITVMPARPVEPIRPVTDCGTCDKGCDCDGAAGTLACGHWGCWGRAHDAIVDCPSAAPLRDHMHAYMQYRKDLHAYEMSSYRIPRR